MIIDYVECPEDPKVPSEYHKKEILFSLLLKYLTRDEAMKYFAKGVFPRSVLDSFSFNGNVTLTTLLDGNSKISFSNKGDEEAYVLYQKSLPIY